MNRFSDVPTIEIPRANFDRSHGLKTTFDGDKLIPVIVDEILPGDTVKLNLSFMARMATPLYPVMHDFYLDTFFFFVPNRLLWSNWKEFCGEQADPDPTFANAGRTCPVVTLDTDMSAAHTTVLSDYFGIPMMNYNVENYSVSTFPFRAYHRVWNEWFRDQNLQDSFDFGLLVGDGPDADGILQADKIQLRGKRHDYFTSALPWLQKGDAVSLPLGTSADIHTSAAQGAAMSIYSEAESAYRGLDADNIIADTVAVATGGSSTVKMFADLSGATAATVNEVRTAFQLQRYLEKNARGGTRYHELLQSHFGTTMHVEAYRSEYLGGGSERIGITPIANTNFQEGTADAGAFLGAQGTAIGSGHGFVKSFVEHGILIGLVCARADLVYQEGLDKMWKRETRFDYYWPTLAHVGEQAILNKELVLDNTMITAGDDEGVFGYQERYAEMKYRSNRLTGLMRSNAGSSLDVWHLAEEFNPTANGTFPILDTGFIESNTPWARVQATPLEPDFIFDGYFKIDHTRCMPIYSIPGMIDHF